MEKIAIIGAGPSGLFLALYLTHHSSRFRRPVSITVFEREDNHDRQDRSNPDRSYTIDITGHGLNAVRALGGSLEKRFDKELIAFRGIHAYAINKTLPYSEKGWTGSRGDICSALLHELQKELAKGVESVEVLLNWNSDVISVDPVSGKLNWRNRDDNKQLQDSFDLIVGADGGGSALRRHLESEGFLTTRKKSISNYSRILHLDHNGAAQKLEASLLHAFSLNPWAVGGAILDIPQPPAMDKQLVVDQADTDKKFYVQMGFSDDKPYPDIRAAESTLEGIRISRDAQAHRSNEESQSLRHYVSDSELESFASRPVYHTGKTVMCSTIAVEKVALLGDAATAFPPVGQGVNAALEGAATLGECLVDILEKQQQQYFSTALTAYNQRWLAQANACAVIANTVVYGSILSRTKLLLQGAFAELTGIDLAAAQLAKSSQLSYVQALQKSRVRNGIAVALGIALSVSLVALLL